MKWDLLASLSVTPYCAGWRVGEETLQRETKTAYVAPLDPPSNPQNEDFPSPPNLVQSRAKPRVSSSSLTFPIPQLSFHAVSARIYIRVGRRNPPTPHPALRTHKNDIPLSRSVSRGSK